MISAVFDAIAVIAACVGHLVFSTLAQPSAGAVTPAPAPPSLALAPHLANLVGFIALPANTR